MCNGRAVIGDRDAGVFRAGEPVFHFSFVKGASAAVDDHGKAA